MARDGNRITQLRLVDFRNYSSLTLDVESRFIVLAGDNGSGKTNLLEAVSLLTPGRGLRRATYPEMANLTGSGGFSVRAGVLDEQADSVDVLTMMRPDTASGPQRQVRIDGTNARSADELLALVRLLWLTPAMDGLFTGPAGDRRRFLDRLVLTLHPEHGRHATDYERAMRSRNRLLAEDRRDESWLSAIESQMAETGLAIALARAETVHRLKAAVCEGFGAGAGFPIAGLELASGYGPVDLSRAAVDVEDEVAGRLRSNRPLDRAAGRTLEGPHRSDLLVTYLAKSMPAALASTGEQKALLIGLILAHAELVLATSGIPPILLLDEVAAHLDAGRRAALFDILDHLGVQSFMTGTDYALFSTLEGRAQILSIANGSLT
ncbi:DNA replication/repair protein RecF [Aureimonas fodinaquatilis]|uniref:DNA replication and repair protein RecF n=1 Tax=Aureimonas fodinaquatilis TaxID=2565783 RepID=A0A5B0E132_9HYPH|nr:DNA replication/repair protein RecF [Aureimonas fodinaquatilis]KAA0971671.1 DNA replication/repair protein RecF [Aureimonas fodinaquatilis]